MSTTENEQQPETPTPEEIARSFKSVTIDGDTTITNHGLKELREDELATERREAFQTGKLRRFTRFNMSGGPD